MNKKHCDNYHLKYSGVRRHAKKSLSFYSEKNIKVGRFSLPFSYFIVLLIFISLVVLLNIQAATMGAKLSHLEQSEEQLVKQKHDLEDSVVRTTSLTKISEQAEDLGFSKPADVLYLDSIEPVAKLLN